MLRPSLLALVLAALPAALAQPAQPYRSVESEPHIVNPAKLPFSPSFADELSAPDGFEVSLFASGLGSPRWLAVGPDGAVYVTRRDSGDVVMLRDADGDGRAEAMRKALTDVPNVHGIHFHGGRVYLVSINEVFVADLRADGSFATPLDTLVDDLPDAGQHPNRTLAVGPDGWLYVTVGSTCNDCGNDGPENATVLRMRLDGSDRGVYARGLRNTIGFGWHPATGELWGMDHGSDWHGDDLPPEELNRIENASDYGWPYCYAEREVDPITNSPPPNATREAYCARTVGAVLTYRAHSAPLQMAFYTADGFPADHRNDAFVAMRGSWNRRPPSGYKVVRVRFGEDGRPEAIEDFLTGFLTDDERSLRGRPVGVAVASDGALLVSDDTNGAIYRVAAAGR